MLGVAAQGDDRGSCCARAPPRLAALRFLARDCLGTREVCAAPGPVRGNDAREVVEVEELQSR
jgi:hypothetical protein